MEQVLKISSAPAKLSFKVKPARIEQTTENPSYQASRSEGGLKMSSKSAKLNIDSSDFFNSINPTTKLSIEQAANRGKSSAYNAGQTYSNNGAMFLEAAPGQDVIEQISINSMQLNSDLGVELAVSNGPDFSYEPARLNTEYQMDKLKFEWRVMQGDFEYIPSEIEFNVEQSDVNIEYVGAPIYVPKSSDPNYDG